MTQRLGMSRATGKKIDPLAHLKQSITDILTTRVGTRLMRRDYGSNLLNLVDNPINPSTITALYAAVAAAIIKWEPRIKLRKVSIDLSDFANGHVGIQLSGVYLVDGRKVQFEGIVV